MQMIFILLLLLVTAKLLTVEAAPPYSNMSLLGPQTLVDLVDTEVDGEDKRERQEYDKEHDLVQLQLGQHHKSDHYNRYDTFELEDASTSNVWIPMVVGTNPPTCNAIATDSKGNNVYILYSFGRQILLINYYHLFYLFYFYYFILFHNIIIQLHYIYDRTGITSYHFIFIIVMHLSTILMCCIHVTYYYLPVHIGIRYSSNGGSTWTNSNGAPSLSYNAAGASTQTTWYALATSSSGQFVVAGMRYCHVFTTGCTVSKGKKHLILHYLTRGAIHTTSCIRFL